MVTIKDVSKNSGFSQATISRLFKNDKTLSISRETRQKIISTALSMGYDRNRIKTIIDKIAILFLITEEDEMRDSYFKQMHHTFIKYGEENNLEVIFITDRDDIYSIGDDISAFIGVGNFTEKELEKLKLLCPIGVLLEINPRIDLFDSIKPNAEYCVDKAISLFIEKGYEKIGFLGGKRWDLKKEMFTKDHREKFFIQKAQDVQRYHPNFIFTEGMFSVEQGYDLATKMIAELGEDGLPDALLIASDTLAIGALQAFNQHKIDIPNQIAIISINDNDFSKYTSPPLTTFKIDVEELAKTAIDLLSEQIIKPRKMTKSVFLTPELIYRKSF